MADYPPIYVTADLVVLTIRDGVLHTLLVERGGEPYAGRLALPGGFVGQHEDLDDAAYRELEEETGLGRGDVLLEQLYTYGTPGRDPRSRVVTVAWLALTGTLPEPVAGSDAAAARWLPVDEALASALAFDHARILADGVERARAKLEYTGYAAALLPQPFTIGELREVYEAVWGHRLDPANFYRKVTKARGFLTETGEATRRSGGRPAQLHRGDPAIALSPPITRGEAGESTGW